MWQEVKGQGPKGQLPSRGSRQTSPKAEMVTSFVPSPFSKLEESNLLDLKKWQSEDPANGM